MLNFPCSTFTWTNHPWQRHPHYKYDGGFVGEYGQVYTVRFSLEAKCEVRDETGGVSTEIFLGAPCRAEYTIADRNLFQVPGSEWRLAFSREHHLTLAARPSWEAEPSTRGRLDERWKTHRIELRELADAAELTDVRSIIDATLRNDVLSARSTYRDPTTGLAVTVEFPVHVMNLNVDDGEFQVCTGPVPLPDLKTWDGAEVDRVFVAQAALSSFDHIEFLLRREAEPAEHEKTWLHEVKGRDRLELHDPDNPPPGDPPPRPKLTAYSEVWELPAENVLLSAPTS